MDRSNHFTVALVTTRTLAPTVSVIGVKTMNNHNYMCHTCKDYIHHMEPVKVHANDSETLFFHVDGCYAAYLVYTHEIDKIKQRLIEDEFLR